MSQFLVLGQPLDNLRLISEGQYRTEARARYEKIIADHNTFKRQFLNVVTVSAFVISIFANMSPPTLKTMAGIFVALIVTGLLFYPANRIHQEEEAVTRKIIEEVTLFVDSYATAKIKAIQELLLYGNVSNATAFDQILDWFEDQYDNYLRPFQISSDDYLRNSALNIKLTPEAEAMRQSTGTIKYHAQKIINASKPLPSHLDSEKARLRRACERLVKITDCNLMCEKTSVADTLWEIRIKNPMYSLNSFHVVH